MIFGCNTLMKLAETDPIASEAAPQDAVAAPSGFVRDERGQISIFVVLCVIPFVFLLAFIFNSAKQTSRKMEMQGAADAASVASAVTMARGMNFMVLNNNAMAEVLALMIAVRCIRDTTRIMRVYVPIKAFAVCDACLWLCDYCYDLIGSIPKWYDAEATWSDIDRFINDESSGMGWRLLRVLDGLNKVVRQSFPLWAAYQARDYARKNGADFDPVYGVVFGGKSENGLALPLPIPTFPVARGPEQAIAFRVEECQYPLFGMLNLVVSAVFPLIDVYSAVEAILICQALRWANINHLKGDWGLAGDVFDQVVDQMPRDVVKYLGQIANLLGQFLGIELLDWPENPPKPMLLTDHPGNDTTDEREVDEDTRHRLRPYLQYLGVAMGRVPRGSPIGGERFLNRPNAFVQMQFTYAQADVYNPKQWDMWTQDWRAQLVRAKLFDEKVNDILQILPSLGSGLDWSYINTH